MKNFAIIGAGFWAKYQLAAWGEIKDAKCVAICDVDLAKARQLARTYDIESVHDDPAKLLAAEQLDFVDIITSPQTHKSVVEIVAANEIDAICQKPLAANLADAESMQRTCGLAGTRLLVHENFRWQRPLRELKRIVDEGQIGKPFRARVQFCSSFPVFEKQPYLADLDRFMLTDVGTHILDVARFLFGDALSLFCSIQRVNPDIRGEDVATVVLQMNSGVLVVNEMSYATRMKDESFPQTFVTVEGNEGSAELVKDYWIHVTTEQGTVSNQYAPPIYPWAERTHDVVHSSMVSCNRNLLSGLTGQGVAETTVDDNLNTLRLVYGSYESAKENKVVRLS